MRVRAREKYLMIFFVISFVIGILYINMIGKEQMISYDIFEKYNFEQYLVFVLERKEYLAYIIKLRLTPLIILGLLNITKLRKISAVLFVLWTGFLAGVFVAYGLLTFSLTTFVLCILGIVPHFVCYIAGYIIILNYMYSYPENRWNSVKTIFIIFVIAIGMILEIYINPIVMKLLIKTL